MIYTVTYKFTYDYETVYSLHIQVKIFKHSRNTCYTCVIQILARKRCALWSTSLYNTVICCYLLIKNLTE